MSLGKKLAKKEIGTEMSTLRKQPKMNRYQLSKSVPTTNFFKGLEKELDDENNNIKLEKIAKPPPIFVRNDGLIESIIIHRYHDY